MIKAIGLSAGYKNKAILKNINFQVDPGEIIVVIGPNGSGKTTLVRSLAGDIRPLSGTVTINGQPLGKIKVRDRARLISVVPQSSLLPGNFSVEETVSFGRTPYLNIFGQINDVDVRISQAALEKVDALDLGKRKVDEISGGEKQRVLLARAIAQQTPIMLLDEPTTYLDLHHQVNFLKLVKKLAVEDAKTIIIALHDLNQAASIADRILLLSGGEMVAFGSPRDVLQEVIISSTYNLKVKVEQIDNPPGFMVLPE